MRVGDGMGDAEDDDGLFTVLPSADDPHVLHVVNCCRQRFIHGFLCKLATGRTRMPRLVA